MTRPTTRYSISMPAPDTHLYEVSLTVDAPGGPTVDFTMPAWTPGSYLLREYARHVQEFSADSRGRELGWRKVAKDTWRVRAGTARSVTVRYKVYAFDLSVRTCHLDATHGFFTGAAVFMFVPGRTAEPCSVRVETPRGWKVATGLRAAGGGTWLASDYDELVDCPVECGKHRTLSFKAAGRPHRIALWGSGNEDEAALVRDTKAIVEAQAEFFGGLPYRDFTFIVHLATGRGGLEHRNSTVLITDRWGFRPRSVYERFLALVSHEYFHVWNVKRIRPEPLGPFDYRRENYTRNLWTMEGVTTYYEKRFLVAAGLISPERWMQLVADDVLLLQSQPGRLRHSLEESSFDAWIKAYRADENSANTTISYYLKGSLVAFLLDLEIRHRTKGHRSLDDVVRRLNRRADPAEPGFAEEGGFLEVVEEVGGRDGGAFHRFFERYVSGHEELDFEGALARAGLAFEWGWKGGAKTAPAWLGAQLQRHGERTTVAFCRADGPAYAAGVYAGDEVVALDGWRVDETSFAARIAENRPTDTVRLTVFRRDELREIGVRLAAAPHDTLRIVPASGANALQKAIRRQLGL